MNFLELAKTRYSTKKYDQSAKISEDKIEALKEILRLSPSSINSQPWKYFFVADEAVKAQLAEVSLFNEPKIKEASHLVVFTAIQNLELFEQQIEKHLPEGAVGYYKQFVKPLPEEEVKAWLAHQVYLSLGFFLGACAAMGIDSTPMEGIKADEYAKILNLEGHKALFAVALGHRNPEDANQPSLRAKSRIPLDEVLVSI